MPLCRSTLDVPPDVHREMMMCFGEYILCTHLMFTAPFNMVCRGVALLQALGPPPNRSSIFQHVRSLSSVFEALALFSQKLGTPQEIE